MELSVRLEALLTMVPPCNAVADIGTDHGFLPIELIKRGICQKAIASDVATGPLERAATHIREAGLEDKIRLCLASGLEGLEAGEADTVLMAGMGGDLMAALVRQAALERRLDGVSCLILQPQSEFAKVRQALAECRYVPFEERMVVDRGKYYWILATRPGTPIPVEAPWQESFGTLLPGRQDPVFKDYLTRREQTVRDLLLRLDGQKGDASSRRREELEAELRELGEAGRYGDGLTDLQK